MPLPWSSIPWCFRCPWSSLTKETLVFGVCFFRDKQRGGTRGRRKHTIKLQPSWPLTGVIRALPGPNVEKNFFDPGASRPQGQKKVEKKSKKGQKRVKNNLFFRLFQPFFDFFSTFFDPGAERPRQLFSTFLGFRARRARMTPVRGQEGCNHKTPPQKWFWTPTYDTFPPSFVHALPFSIEEMALEGALYSLFSPQKNCTTTFCPPPCDFSISRLLWLLFQCFLGSEGANISLA